MLYSIIIFIFVIICFLLIGIILLQNSKSGGFIGGGTMNTAFGGHGADKLLVKITSGLAVSFMVLAITIGMIENPSSRLDFSNKPTLSRNEGASLKSDIKNVEDAAPLKINKESITKDDIK